MAKQKKKKVKAKMKNSAHKGGKHSVKRKSAKTASATVSPRPPQARAPEARPPQARKKDTRKAETIRKEEIVFAEKIELERSTHTYRTAIHRRYGKYYRKARKPTRIALKTALVLFTLGVAGVASLFIVFGRELPDVTKLKTMNFSETTRIYDREGHVLYSIFDEENRKYVPLSYIAPLAISATLSIEDKNFYNHIGFDVSGMVRAQMRNMREDSISQGASTITQQLAKNIFLSPERTYERKIRELLLALEIEWLYSKEEILEMYLNKISYGSNSYGIEAAAQTYFGKTSRDLNLVESAVLASLPKAPSYYSPYGQNKKQLLGYCGKDESPPPTAAEAADALADTMTDDFENAETPENPDEAATANTESIPAATPATLAIKATGTVWVQVVADGKTEQYTLRKGEEKNHPFNGEAKITLGNMSVEILVNGRPQTLTTKYLALSAADFTGREAAETESVSATADEAQAEKSGCESPYDPDYVWGRKDLVLERMVEDRHITKSQFEEAWREGLTLKLRDPVHRIEAPHFVFYVKEMLEQKYGKEMVESGGLEVRTSLDPKMQSLAEEAVRAHAGDNLRKYDANNAAMVAIDPKTGQILAMVGSVDYWNHEIDGQVNVAASPRQPGSAFKPLVYALAIQNKGIGSGTILSDYKTVFNKKDVPRNSDNQYKGKMTVRTALSNSRNIPAIKAYYLAGEEEEMLDFLDKVGLTSLRRFRDNFNKNALIRGWTFFYGWPMAIGSGEVKLIDLASAYGAFANEGKYIPLNPILEVRDRKGNILEKHEVPEGVQAMDPQAAYIINSILSDVNARPAGSWRASMTIEGQTVAAKTGTSNKKVGKAIYPNNNVMVGYTPGIVAAVWVGNTNGDKMKNNAWAFADAGPIWKDFLSAVLKDKPDEPFPVPEGIVWKGKEVYPSFADYKSDFDKPFRTMETEETQTQAGGDGSFISSGSSANQPEALNSNPNSANGGSSGDAGGANGIAVDELPPKPEPAPEPEEPIAPAAPDIPW